MLKLQHGNVRNSVLYSVYVGRQAGRYLTMASCHCRYMSAENRWAVESMKEFNVINTLSLSN